MNNQLTHAQFLKSNLIRSTSGLAITIAAVASAVPAIAQVGDEIIVTATRRAESIQDIPFNIAAVGGAQIEQQGFDDISELIAYVPGISIVDQGGRDGNRIVVRGLNADPIAGGGGGAGSDGGGTVSPYIGEIPLFVDLKLNDLERVEVLLGPQGTLYGAGTLGGAIRYIPKRPSFDGFSAEIRGDAYSYKEGDGISFDTGATVNYAISDNFAFRASLDYQDDKGFIDYPFVVQAIGVSTPDPDFTNPADVDANLRRVEDANTEEILSGRAALRWQPNDNFDANLTYYFQNRKNGGRTTSGLRGPLQTGRFESPLRVEEPAKLDTRLLALEVVADLGFAELTSASGISLEKFLGQRDQTDLLVSLPYTYDTFPSFTGFTQEVERDERFNQELRLVSQNEGPLNWIVGGFYNKNDAVGVSSEFTPGFGDFAGGRPSSELNDLEFYSIGKSKLVEQAVFGEIGYDITEAWSVTVGARAYGYQFETADSAPSRDANGNIITDAEGNIINETTVFFPVFGGCPLDRCNLSIDEVDDTYDIALNQEFSGELFKVNTSYKFGSGNSVYATFSQGYRIGASNGLAPCPDIFVPGPQGQCGLVPGQQFGPNPGDIAEINERDFFPDTVDNFEVGAKTTWLDGDLTLNGALFFIKWDAPQVASASVNANLPIRVNAGAAESKGFEISGNWRVNDNFSLRGNYSFTQAELTEDVPSLVRTLNSTTFEPTFEDGLDGDRLPGSPESQFSIFGNYEQPLYQGDVFVNAGYSWQGNVLSRTGARGSSLTLPSFGIANASVGYSQDNWTITAYADNLFNEYAESSVVGTQLSNTAINQAGRPLANGLTRRSFRTNVLPPRVLGARFSYKFNQ